MDKYLRYALVVILALAIILSCTVAANKLNVNDIIKNIFFMDMILYINVSIV